MQILRGHASLALILVLAACGDKENNSGSTTGTTDATASTSTSTSADTSASEPTTTPTSTPTQASDSASSTATTGTTASTSDATSASSSTGAAECQIDPPDPGQCNGGKPAGAAPRFTGPPVAGGQHPGPGPLQDPPEELFASGFIEPPDFGGGPECDIFGDDCGPGEKCNAWANDGGSSWNSTKCFPAGTDPIGAPCMVEGSGVSGVDSCVKGAMCWNADDNNMGVCVEQCTCSIDNPICTTPNTTCTISNNGVLVLCLPFCDPLDQDACPAGDVCIANPSGNLFICVIDASGDGGGANDPCDFANACDPGFLCGNSGDCGGAGCCNAYCDLDRPNCGGGSECMPYYAPGEAPQCFEDVGVCVAP